MAIFRINGRLAAKRQNSSKAAAGVLIIDMQHPIIDERVQEGYQKAGELIAGAKQLGLPIALIRFSRMNFPVNSYIRKMAPHAPLIEKSSENAFESREVRAFLESNLLEKRVVLSGFNKVACLKETAIAGSRAGYEMLIAQESSLGMGSNLIKEEMMADLDLALEGNIRLFERVSDLLSHLSRIIRGR